MPEFTANDFPRLVTLFVPETVSALAFSPNGEVLAVSAGDKVHIYRIPDKLRAAARQAAADSVVR